MKRRLLSPVLAIFTALALAGVVGVATSQAGSQHLVGKTTGRQVARISANGCTVANSSIQFFPKPNYNLKPATGFTINCNTARQWGVDVDCQVNAQAGIGQINWTHCANTGTTTVNAFNSGGTYLAFVGNGGWGCVNDGNHAYRGRLTFDGITWASDCSGSGCLGAFPTDAWKCTG